MWIADAPDNSVCIKAFAVTERRKESPGRVERILAAGKAARCEISGDETILRSASHMQWFCHAAEIDTNAGSRTRRNCEHMSELFAAQSGQFCCCDSSTERADGAGGMETRG